MAQTKRLRIREGCPDIILDRRRITPEPGTVLTVNDPAVWGALIQFGHATEVGAPAAVPEEPAVADSSTETMPAPEGDTDSDSESAATEHSGLTWEDIDRLSDTARNKLMTAAPEADPATATPEEIEAWLQSKQMAVYAKRALRDHFGRDEGWGET